MQETIFNLQQQKLPPTPMILAIVIKCTGEWECAARLGLMLKFTDASLLPARMP